MGWKRLTIAVDCDNDEQCAKIQLIMNDLSNILRLKAQDIIDIYPKVKKNQSLLTGIFNKIVNNPNILKIFGIK